MATTREILERRAARQGITVEELMRLDREHLSKVKMAAYPTELCLSQFQAQDRYLIELLDHVSNCLSCSAIVAAQAEHFKSRT